MAKPKYPKKQIVRETPNEKDTDAQLQDAPRKFRQLKKFLDLQHKKKQTETPKPKKKQKTTEESLNELRQVVNQTAKRQTKKYEKRKAFLDQKKQKKEQDEEIRLVDHIKFGEQVQEPPKLTAIPKKKGYIKTPKAPNSTTKKVALVEKMEDSVGRKHKLKELSEADRVTLLQERQRLIDFYRSKKKS
jgi:putative protein kinase ArgK-like GTPase of G3E family